MFVDSFRSTLGFDRAAALWIDLIESGNTDPIVNICGDRDLSKYDVGLLIAEREHLDTKLIVPVSANDSKEWCQIQRAESTLMDNTLLKEILQLRTIDVFKEPQKMTSAHDI